LTFAASRSSIFAFFSEKGTGYKMQTKAKAATTTTNNTTTNWGIIDNASIIFGHQLLLPAGVTAHEQVE